MTADYRHSGLALPQQAVLVLCSAAVARHESKCSCFAAVITAAHELQLKRMMQLAVSETWSNGLASAAGIDSSRSSACAQMPGHAYAAAARYGRSRIRGWSPAQNLSGHAR
jgi:hypothetical protein